MTGKKKIIDFGLGEKIFQTKEKHETFVKGFYERDLGDYIEKINSSLMEKNWLELSREAHSLQVKCEYLGCSDISGLAGSLHQSCREKSPDYSTIFKITKNLLKEAYFLKSFLDEKYTLAEKNQKSSNITPLFNTKSSSDKRKSWIIKRETDSVLRKQFSGNSIEFMRIEEFEISVSRIPPPICKASEFQTSKWDEEEELDPLEEISKTWKCNLL